MHERVKVIETALLIDDESNTTRAHREIEKAVRAILTNVGEDPHRDGLRKTPERVARMYDELLSGYAADPVTLINDATFESDYDQMVLVRDIEFFSLCEHHLLPFFGRVHIAYLPKGKVLGLSKMPRVVEMFSRRLQIQERMTNEIAKFLDDWLHPEGVAVMVTGRHLCSMMRGVKKVNAKMVTQTFLGKFKEREMSEQLFREIYHPSGLRA
ncbi:MAG: GTP cyclohydrolase I FolE [Chloroflexi bacterium]|nr:GTP cyclohydrolase I FolE [Chloroflexota bacterium]